jgi:hypothetical protein
VRAALLALLALLLALALPGVAAAGILTPEDATDAANVLSEAQEEQDICYGWQISNDFGAGPDVGSSTGGPDAIVIQSLCDRYVVLTGNIHYSCGSCEDSDSAEVDIESNLPNPPTRQDLEDLGLDAGDLTGDNDDTTLVNMIEALPLLAAQSGAAPALPAETPTAVPSGDVATNKPGSDFIRESWLKLLFFVLLLAAGPLLILYKRAQTPLKET